MRRVLSIAIIGLSIVGFLSARNGAQPTEPTRVETKIIDTKSDVMGPVRSGDSVIFFVGNFAAQHNGAVITCDSAVSYSDDHFEFFGNVLINKNTTYIYGDRVEYNGEINEARVFSDLVKVVDGDATLYTYQFLFNTKDNIGEFYDGGVLTNRESTLEAIRGYYYTDTKELIGVEEVEMRNEEYALKGDSVVYNIETDNAFFFDRTNIWSKDNDYLYADRGSYSKADTLYKVTRNGYVLTEKQEMWSDSIDYYRPQEHVVLRHDFQIDDTEHKVLTFGDYGEYWKNPGNAFLTRRPSLVSYDQSQGDSVFMRGDSIYLYTINRLAEERAAAQAKADSVARVEASKTIDAPAVGADSATKRLSVVPLAGEGGASVQPADSLAARPMHPDSVAARAAVPTDSLGRPIVPDSLAQPVADTVQLTPEAQKAKLKEAAAQAKAAKKEEAAKAKKAKLDEIAAKRHAKLQALKERDEKRLAAAKLKAESKLRARQARAARKGKHFEADSTQLQELDSLLNRNAIEQDSLARMVGDTLAVDSLRADTLAVDTLATTPADSIYRFIRSFRNVKMYRTDAQVVCDSMTASSTDSTIHLYINPVMWNQNNQITSDVMDIYTQNQQITRAEFVGSPFMAAQIDTAHYNQIAGKEMTAFFRENAVYRNDVNGNVQTIYYMEDGEPPVATDVGFIDAGDATFYIEEKQVVNIVYRKDATFNIYSLKDLPADRLLYLKNFKWEGARRPTKEEVFDRRIRPSERDARSQLRQPQFPIQQRVEEFKKRLIELRRWYDRNEQVDEETAEWMRTLGYTVGEPRESKK